MTGDFDDMFQGSSPARWAHRVAPQADGATPTETAGSGQYKPYGFTPADDLETCEVAWWLRGEVPQGVELQYRFLVRIGYLGDDHLHLFLTDCVIYIEGKNLRDLRKRLARRRVTFIQAFHPSIWPTPPEGEPVILKVSVQYPGELKGTGANQ